MVLTQIDGELVALQNQKARVKMDLDVKEDKIAKYNQLIEQSEGAYRKMLLNVQKLDDAIGEALREKF